MSQDRKYRYSLLGEPTVSYEPLHHKYRPQTFADLVGQEAIATTLASAIHLKRIAPAYLFTGPRGTGKTSSARILAKSLNCVKGPDPTAEPCGICDVCQSITRGNALDVIEIDAASNTGVDNIRDLIERAQFAPVQCRYKIYCLDEVHMLSTAAFNALLKTLEEPPDQVVFILATTDPQRVLPTIISRCQRFDFRRIPLLAMTQHLAMIAQVEQIEIAPTALELVSQISQGGLRDAESLLDQLSLLAGEITIDRVWDLVGSVPEQDLMTLCQAIASANPEIILERTRHLLDKGREPLIVLQNLTGFYRDLLIAKTAPTRRDLVAITENTWTQLCQFTQSIDLNTILAGQQHLRACELQVKNTTQPRLWLEVALLGLIPYTTVHLAASTANLSAPAQPIQATVAPPIQPVFNGHGDPSQGIVSVPVPSDVIVPSAIAQPHPPEPQPAPPDFVAMESVDVGFTPAPTASAPVQISPVEVPSPSLPDGEMDLAQLWQKLLQQLNRPSQALLSQHGQLLFFKGREAQIGIRNSSLARIAQSKLPDVEAAFLKVFNRKVGVSLQIMTAEPPAVPSNAPPAGTSEPLASTPFTPVPPVAAVALAPPIPFPTKPQETVVALPPDPRSSVEVESAAPPTQSWETYDELTQSARNFAQFFNGAMVHLDPLDATPEVTELSSMDAALNKAEPLEWDEPELNEP
jgi:DNA polymerase III subunit gamma/tau